MDWQMSEHLASRPPACSQPPATSDKPSEIQSIAIHQHLLAIALEGSGLSLVQSAMCLKPSLGVALRDLATSLQWPCMVLVRRGALTRTQGGG